jgi:hypothetical protein
MREEEKAAVSRFHANRPVVPGLTALGPHHTYIVKVPRNQSGLKWRSAIMTIRLHGHGQQVSWASQCVLTRGWAAARRLVLQDGPPGRPLCLLVNPVVSPLVKIDGPGPPETDPEQDGAVSQPTLATMMLPASRGARGARAERTRPRTRPSRRVGRWRGAP